MPKFYTYTTETNPEGVAVTEDEFMRDGMPDDWMDYVVQEAPDPETAVTNHQQRLDEFMAEQSGMSVEDYLNQ